MLFLPSLDLVDQGTEHKDLIMITLAVATQSGHPRASVARLVSRVGLQSLAEGVIMISSGSSWRRCRRNRFRSLPRWKSQPSFEEKRSTFAPAFFKLAVHLWAVRSRVVFKSCFSLAAPAMKLWTFAWGKLLHHLMVGTCTGNCMVVVQGWRERCCHSASRSLVMALVRVHSDLLRLGLRGSMAASAVPRQCL